MQVEYQSLYMLAVFEVKLVKLPNETDKLILSP